MQLHWVDIAIILVIGLSVLTGLFRGFVKELVALCVWVLAIWLGYHYAESLDPWLKTYFQEKSVRTAIAFILILFGTLLAGGIVNTILSFILKRAGLSGTDRTLGMCFGFLRGVFIVTLIIIAVQLTSLPYQDYAKNSQLYGRFDPLVAWLNSRLPEFVTKVKAIDKTESVIDTIAKPARNH